MAQNLFIGSLAYATTDDSLKAFFETLGEVTSARVVTDRETGRSRGFGFVEYADEANNQKAVDELNGKELDGRAINVSLARPKEDRPRREGGDRSFGGDRSQGGGSFRQRSWEYTASSYKYPACPLGVLLFCQIVDEYLLILVDSIVGFYPGAKCRREC